MIDQDAAWAALHDSATDGAALAGIVQQYPEFAEAVLRHPNCYDGLRQWIGEYASAPAVQTTSSVVQAALAQPESQPASEPMAPTTRRRSRRLTVLAVVAVGALVLAGGGAWAVVSMSRAQPVAAEVPSADSAGALQVTGAPPTASSFNAGAKLAWQVGGENATAVVDPRTWLVVEPETGTQTTTLVGVDAPSGRQQWKKNISDIIHCAPVALSGSAYCYLTQGGMDQRIEKISLADGSTQAAYPLPDSNPDTFVDEIQILDGGIVILQTFGEGANAGVITRLPPDLSRPVWDTQVSYETEGDPIPGAHVIRMIGGTLVLEDGWMDFIVDFASGELLGASAHGQSDLIADGTIVGAGDAAVQASSHGAHALVLPDSGTQYPVDFSMSPQVPTAPILYASTQTGDSTQWRTDISEQPVAGGAASWTTSLSTTSATGAGLVYGAVDEGHLAILDNTGGVTSLDPKSGAVQWTNNYSAPTSRGFSDMDFSRPSPFYLDATTLAVVDQQPGTSNTPMLLGFDAATGRTLWKLDGVGLAQPYGTAADTAVFRGPSGVGPLVGSGSTTSVVASEASGMAPCPDGMSPVSWSTYPGGHVLVCSGKQHFVVDVVVKDKARSCGTLTFDSGGYTLSCTGIGPMRVVGGGAFVQFGSGPSGWIQPAAATWSTYAPVSTTTTGFGKRPASLRVSCPTGSQPISLSIWKGGWLLICGTDAVTATSFVYRAGQQSITGGGMTYEDGRYCGADKGGVQVCASGTPAVVSMTPKGGDASQYSVSANYFATTGAGGSGKGTGAYGVQAPKAAAPDQVRYLTQILQKSEQGRTAVAQLVANLLRCQITAGDQATAASVTENRQELLAALASTPVDKVDGGQRLVAELTQALTASLEADQHYEQAAAQILAGSCDGGLSTMRSVKATADQSEQLKQTFIDDWNSTVVGKFDGVPTFDTSHI